MDLEFVAELRAGLQQMPELTLLPDAEADQLRRRVAERFGFQDNQSWWWERLPAAPKSIVYGQGDGLTVLHSSLPVGAEQIFLFVTDDEPPPWPCIAGSPDLLMQMLGGLRFVECFFVDAALDWILFDTHHNALVGYGEALRMP